MKIHFTPGSRKRISPKIIERHNLITGLSKFVKAQAAAERQKYDAGSQKKRSREILRSLKQFIVKLFQS